MEAAERAQAVVAREQAVEAMAVEEPLATAASCSRVRAPSGDQRLGGLDTMRASGDVLGERVREVAVEGLLHLSVDARPNERAPTLGDATGPPAEASERRPTQLACATDHRNKCAAASDARVHGGGLPRRTPRCCRINPRCRGSSTSTPTSLARAWSPRRASTTSRATRGRTRRALRCVAPGAAWGGGECKLHPLSTRAPRSPRCARGFRRPRPQPPLPPREKCNHRCRVFPLRRPRWRRSRR